MAAVWLIHIGIIVWLVLRLPMMRQTSLNRRYFWFGITFKILGGALLGLYYKNFGGGGDTWGFFESSKILSNWAVDSPWQYVKALAGGPIPDNLPGEIGYANQPRALLMVKIISVFSLLTGNSYWLTCCYFSLFSFSGLWLLVNRIAESYPESAKSAMVAFIFLPSALFWGSGISKEAIFMGGFGFLISWFWPRFAIKNKAGLIHWLAGLAMLSLLFLLKYYYVAVLIPVLLATVIQSRLIGNETTWIKTHLSWLLIFVLLLFLASWLHPNLRLDHVAYVVKHNAATIAINSSKNALIQFLDYPDAGTWMAINFPWAVLTGLLRPNIGDWGTVFQNIAVVEQLVISVLLIGKFTSIRPQDFKQPDWLPCLVYVLVLAGLLTLSTPNFGTLVRYKVSYLPVFVFMVLYRNRFVDFKPLN